MDENQIAEKLKENLPKSEPQDDSYPEPEQNHEPDHSNLPLENMVLKQEVADFLNLPRGYKQNPEMVTQLETVISWAQDIAGTTDPSDILHVIGRQQGRMGIRDKQDKLLRLYSLVKIQKQMDALYERERSLYGR